MGVDAKPTRIESKHENVKRPRLNRRVAIAAPALAGIAAAAVLSSQALSSSPVADVKPAPHKAAAANLTVTNQSAKAASANAADAAKAKAKANAAAKAKANRTQLERRTVSATQWYRVRSGDTLSGIAGRFYHQTSAWPVIYYANRGKISSADIISPGEVLRIPVKPAHIPAAPAAPAPPVAVASSTSTARSASPVTTAQSTASYSYSGGGYPGGAFGACVVARESGGNSQVMNSSGHYGLYQFSYSTWVAYGGNPGDFGHASAAEQNQVFATALARGGQSNWSPYDGC